MKKLLVAALLVVGMTTFAQQKDGKPGRERLTSEQKVDLQVKRMTKDLDLNEKQIQEIKTLIAKQVEKREATKAELKDVKEKQRAEIKADIEKDQVAVTAEMKKILTADQFAKWEKMREERKGKAKERMMQRKEKGQSK
ncbi:MAG: hypothetical protein QM710_05660 [Flavobacterium sp.]